MQMRRSSSSYALLSLADRATATAGSGHMPGFEVEKRLLASQSVGGVTRCEDEGVMRMLIRTILTHLLVLERE